MKLKSISKLQNRYKQGRKTAYRLKSGYFPVIVGANRFALCSLQF